MLGWHTQDMCAATHPPTESPCQQAAALIAEFAACDSFGSCHACEPADVPQPFRQLLDHQAHMTVTMEAFHGEAVSLEVLAVAENTPGPLHPFAYSREILLRCGRVNPELFPQAQAGGVPSADWIVQYGIVGIALERLPQAVADAIREASTPLGRILIEAGLHRRVHDVALVNIEPGPHLKQILTGNPSAQMPSIYGRVATIDVNGHPVISLLEVVAVPNNELAKSPPVG